MYLIDTNVVSEMRKRLQANAGVRKFFRDTAKQETHLYLSVITIGELRRGVELIRHRGDRTQAGKLESWLEEILASFDDQILGFTCTEAQVWGKLRVPNHANAIDKIIAATALSYDLTLVTRNTRDFAGTGVRLIDPFL